MISTLRKLKTRGLVHVLETRFNRYVPTWLFRFSVGDVLELDLAALDAYWNLNSPADYVFGRVTEPAQRELLRTLTWNSVPIETTEADFGYSVARADAEGDWIGGVWAGNDSFLESDLGFQISLQSHQSWLYCAYVDRAARGQGLYRSLMAFVGQDLLQHEKSQLLVIIQPWNKASMHVHRQFATGELGRIIVLRVLWMSLIFSIGKLQQERGFTFRQRSNPVTIKIP